MRKNNGLHFIWHPFLLLRCRLEEKCDAGSAFIYGMLLPKNALHIFPISAIFCRKKKSRQGKKCIGEKGGVVFLRL